MRRRFLVVYDYGQGGAWAYVAARSAAEIGNQFPELKVVDRPPDWMSKQELARIEVESSYELDRPDTGLLAHILQERLVDGGRGSAHSG